MLFFILTGIFLCLLSNGIEKTPPGQSETMFAFESALNLKLRSIISMKLNSGFESLTYRILVFILMIFGFVILSYYKAQMNAALNVDNNQIPFDSWDDVEKSGYKILVYKGGMPEEKFLFAHNSSNLRRIYQKQIKSVPTSIQLQNIKTKGSIPYLMTEDYMAYSPVIPYTIYPEFPCSITNIDSPQLL